jgi:hypothetical protein
VSRRVDQQRGLFVDGDVTGSIRPALGVDTAHEGKISSHAVAGTVLMGGGTDVDAFKMPRRYD